MGREIGKQGKSDGIELEKEECFGVVNIDCC